MVAFSPAINYGFSEQPAAGTSHSIPAYSCSVVCITVTDKVNSLRLILWLQQATLKVNMHAELENNVLQILWGLSVTISCFSVWPSHRSTRRTWCVRCCRTLSMCFVPSAERPTILADLCPLGQPLSCITHCPWLTLTRLFSMWLLFLPNLPRLSSASAALRLGHLKATCSSRSENVPTARQHERF